jgi:hypothetical protein
MKHNMAVLLQDIAERQCAKCNDLFLFRTGPPSGEFSGTNGGKISGKLPFCQQFSGAGGRSARGGQAGPG